MVNGEEFRLQVRWLHKTSRVRMLHGDDFNLVSVEPAASEGDVGDRTTWRCGACVQQGDVRGARDRQGDMGVGAMRGQWGGAIDRHARHVIDSQGWPGPPFSRGPPRNFNEKFWGCAPRFFRATCLSLGAAFE